MSSAARRKRRDEKKAGAAPTPAIILDRADGNIIPGMQDQPGEPPSQATREDLQLVRTAIKSRWPIPAAGRRRIIAEALSIVRNGLASNRSKIAATKVLIEADRINLEQERRDELGTAADVKKIDHSGSIDLKTLTDEQLQQLIDG